MDATSANNARIQFQELLKRLAENDNAIKSASDREKAYRELEELYDVRGGQRFRHYYSDVFSVLMAIRQDPSKWDVGMLRQNLEVLLDRYDEYAESSQDADIKKQLTKLYDHVNLEAAHFDYSDSNIRQQSETEAENKFKNFNDEIREASEEIQRVRLEAQNRIAGIEKDHIAILGIFASIVIAFTAGISFTTASLSAIGTVKPFRLILLALIIGEVLINTLYGLFYYVDILVHRDGQKGRVKIQVVANTFMILLIVAAWIANECGLFDNL